MLELCLILSPGENSNLGLKQFLTVPTLLACILLEN